MKPIMIAALLVLSGCASIDSAVSKDSVITSDDIITLSQACKGRGGVMEARRMYVVMSGTYEWRVSCKDGTNVTK